MDLFDLLDEGWSSAKANGDLAKSQTSNSMILKPVTPAEDQTRPLEHSLSDGSLAPARLSQLREESSRELQGSLSSGAATSLPRVLEEQVLADDVSDRELDTAIEPQQRYEPGLGPAPPLVTAIMLLLLPVWLPVLAIFLLPLAMTWAFIAGISLVTAAMLGMLNRSVAMMRALGWKQHTD